jgi:universal stress protein E
MFTNALFVAFSHPHTVPALRSVIDLVRSGQGRTTVMAVVEPTPALQRLLTPREAIDQVEGALQRTLSADLDRWVTKAAGERAPADVVVEVASGHVVATVLQQIVDEDHDLLAMTGHPDDPFARAVIKRLQRKSPCPVWAIRPSRARKRRILAAVDTDPEHHGLDHRILTAAEWLASTGGEVHVLTAWELLGESTLRSSPFVGVGASAVDELRDRCEADHHRTLAELVGEHQFDDIAVHLHVRNGPAADVIVDMVEHHHINQLVMGTIGRTGIPGFVIGNTAERLLGEVACSEFVVKPPGFSSSFVG